MKKVGLFFLFCTFAVIAKTQSSGVTFAQAEALRLNYQFKEAASAFSVIAKQSKDSLERIRAEQHLILCENGHTLLRYIEKPIVTGRINVPRHTFYNYYNIDFGGGWAFTPPELLQIRQKQDTLSPVFIPSANVKILYYASQQSGNWDIYVTRQTDDSQWTAPEPLGSNINTPFDERFPYVTPDGNALYFSSNGHSGMGGYDLYKSTYNATTQQWSTPENLGFPYSSPYDDFLFVPNADQTMAVFTSSREQKKDSLTLYRIMLEANPVKQSGASIKEIQKLAKLEPGSNAPEEEMPVVPDEPSNDGYRALRKTLAMQQQNERLLQNDLQCIRKMYALLDEDEERTAVQNKIMEYESRLQQMQGVIRQTTERIQQAEQALLEKGIIPDATTPVVASPTTSATVDVPPFLSRFRPNVAWPSIAFLPPPAKEPEADDYTFRTGTIPAVFTQALPQGLIYEIQIGTLSRKLPANELKGLSPVFIQPDKNMYIHYIGYFATYSEAAKALPEVKKKFKEPIIVAFLNAKKTTIKIARDYELKKKPVVGKPALPTNATLSNRKIILGEYPNGLPQVVRQAVQAATSRDIVKATSKGRSVYVVGPFATEDEAQKVASQLRAKGFETTIE